MARKNYDWKERPALEPHTKAKHDILRAYFSAYLQTRCGLPQRERFRIVVVDGFAGGGLYRTGEYGSPIIFVECLKQASRSINAYRAANGMKPLEIECLMLTNDKERVAAQQLELNLAPHLASIKDECPHLKVDHESYSDGFQALYPRLKNRIQRAKCKNVFFNLDQCGYSLVSSGIIRDILSSWTSAEVLLTFSIDSALTFVSQDRSKSKVPLEPEIVARLEEAKKNQNQGMFSTNEWLGVAERAIFAHLKDCATYVSPFAIKNPTGWRYWLMHFANVPRARQVYNNVLHESETSQGHYGRAGLKMLEYDFDHDSPNLYLFSKDSREMARESLHEDIPRLISESGDVLSVSEFYATAYSETPAHSDDIHQCMIDSPEIEIITPDGGKRRSANGIRPDDTMKLTLQRSFLFGFDD